MSALVPRCGRAQCRARKLRQGGSGGKGHQCYHLEPPVVPCEQNSVPFDGECGGSTTQPRNQRTTRGSDKRPQRGYYESGGGGLYLDELRFNPPERFITRAELRNEPPRHRSYYSRPIRQSAGRPIQPNSIELSAKCMRLYDHSCCMTTPCIQVHVHVRARPSHQILCMGEDCTARFAAGG